MRIFKRDFYHSGVPYRRNKNFLRVGCFKSSRTSTALFDPLGHEKSYFWSTFGIIFLTVLRSGAKEGLNTWYPENPVRKNIARKWIKKDLHALGQKLGFGMDQNRVCIIENNRNRMLVHLQSLLLIQCIARKWIKICILHAFWSKFGLSK